MKKVIKTGVVLALAAVLIVAGVFAAKTYSFSATSKVSFTATSAFVDVTGDVYISAGSIATDNRFGSTMNRQTYSQNGTDRTPDASVDDWDMGELTFTDADNVITVVLAFTNVGPKTTRVTIVAPDAPTGTALAKYEGAAAVTSGGTVSTDTADLGEGESITFTYILTLIDFSTDINAVDFNFAVNITTELV